MNPVIPIAQEKRKSRRYALRSFRQFAGKHVPWLFLLLCLALLPFVRELVSNSQVISDLGGATAQEYFFTRGFAAAEIANGTFPFWNPYNYGGAPFLGDFHSELLYLPNLVFLIFPLVQAINLIFIMHIAILGMGMYAWGLFLDLRRSAAFLSGTAAMFGGTFFLHVYAGHLPAVCTMAWAPLVFLSIDGWIKRRRKGWIVLAAVAVALQIYAGELQWVYYTLLISGIYSLASLIGCREVLKASLGLLAMGLLAVGFSAAQILPGMVASSEWAQIESSSAYGRLFSFPPENFLTLFAPNLFGALKTASYWGRDYFWEMNAHLGIGMILLSVLGLYRMEDNARRLRYLTVILAAALLSIIARTPLYSLLYCTLPGFGQFCGTSKFLFFAALFIALAAGYGMNSLLSKQNPNEIFSSGLLIAGCIFLAAAFLLRDAWSLQWKAIIEKLLASPESQLPQQIVSNPNFIFNATGMSATSLASSGRLLFLFGMLFFLLRFWSPAKWALLAAAIADIFIFACSNVTSFDANAVKSPGIANFAHGLPADSRIVNLISPGSSMAFRSEDAWGCGSHGLKRYAEFMLAGQGMKSQGVAQKLSFGQSSPTLPMVRCRYIIRPKSADQAEIFPVSSPPFPRFFTVSNYKIVTTLNELERDLTDSQVNLRKCVLLEREPNPIPENATQFEYKILSNSSNQTTLEVTVDKASILVMTDAWSKDIHAESLPGSVQFMYEVYPAYHALRAIPLVAGKHVLRVEYYPSGFGSGLFLTTLAIVGMIIGLVRRDVAF